MTGEQAVTHQNRLQAMANGMALRLLPIGEGRRTERQTCDQHPGHRPRLMPAYNFRGQAFAGRPFAGKPHLLNPELTAPGGRPYLGLAHGF